MLDLGTVRPGSTIRIPFSSFDKDDGSAITMTNYAAADILVYKDGSTTERASTAGFTATTDFDTKTGKHLAIIDLADNTTAGFFNAGSEYLVAIDAVTIDAVTTGGWIARFRIGYPSALLDTTIATLSTQTSFTLTAGPAEDNALVGCYAIIHDIASAVQLSKVLITAYTGSTKTVTLAAGATFTAAAGDNISVLYEQAALQPTVLGRTLDVTTTGEAGIDWNNIGAPTTTVNLSGTTVKTASDVETDTQDIQSRLPAALTADGNIKADTLRVGGTLQTAGDIPAMVTAVDDYVDTEVAAIKAKTDNLPAAPAAVGDIPSAATIAAAVFDEAMAGHTTAGTSGKALADILAAVDTEIAAIKAKTDNLPADPADASDIAASFAALNNLSAAQVNAEADTAIADALNSIADAFLDRAAAVEGYTPRQLFRLFAAVLVGKANGLATTTANYRDVADTKNRVVATVDADGNRSAVTLDAT